MVRFGGAGKALYAFGQLEQHRHPRRIVQCAVEYLLIRVPGNLSLTRNDPSAQSKQRTRFSPLDRTFDFATTLFEGDFHATCSAPDCRRHPSLTG